MKKTREQMLFEEKYSIATNQEENKVILDTDLTYMGDDMYALFGMLKADELGYVDLLGITTVGGNSLVAPETYDVLSILEYVGRGEVPVYMGEDIPLKGFWKLDELFDTIGKMSFVGGYRYVDQYTDQYDEAEKLSKTKLPKAGILPQEENAVNFMIEQVHKYPGKVTIMAIGSCINVARAIQKDPMFAELAAGIIYMGGVFDVFAEDLHGIEINWWYDPEAADVCLRANWKSQVAVPHDTAVTCKKGRDVYDRYKAKNRTKMTELLVRELAPIYENNQVEELLYCWDPIVVATYLCPDLIEKEEIREVAICTQKGYGYAQCFGWKEGRGAKGAAACNIIFQVKRQMFWDFMTDLYAIGE